MRHGEEAHGTVPDTNPEGPTCRGDRWDLRARSNERGHRLRSGGERDRHDHDPCRQRRGRLLGRYRPGDCGQHQGPRGVAVDAAGNVYIVDTLNVRIRKVDTAGVITTFAGTGAPGDTGDTGQATAAQVNAPFGIAVDGAGNVYIADTFNHRIRKVDTAGVITTFAGTGAAGDTGDTGQATAAELNLPFDVDVDAAGNVYIADTGNSRIRKVDTAGVITTFAGTGVATFGGDSGQATAAQLNGPTGVAAGPAGNVYIADSGNDRVRKVDAGGVITTVAGTGVPGFSGDTGQATAAQLDEPSGVAVDAAGNVYIADFNNSRVRKVNAAGVITTLAGTGVPRLLGRHRPGIARPAQLRLGN